MDSLYKWPAATKCCNSRCQTPFVLGLHRLVGCGLLARLNKYKIWELKREQNCYSRMENGIRGNGQEKRKIVSVPATETFFSFLDRFPVFPRKTVYGRVKRNTEPVGIGFSRPVFTPSRVDCQMGNERAIVELELRNYPLLSANKRPNYSCFFVWKTCKTAHVIIKAQ